MARLRLGAVAFLDALGFKGIWTRADPGKVLSQMKRLRRRGRGLQGSGREGVILSDDGFVLSIKSGAYPTPS